VGRRIFLFVARLLGRLGLSPARSGPALRSRLLQRLLHLVLNLPTQRLQRFVDLSLNLFPGQLERLLHLLAHSISDLALQFAEDGLDGLTNLLLKRLTQIRLCRGGRSLVTTLLSRGPASVLPFPLPCPPILSPGLGLTLLSVTLVAALTVLTS